MLSDSRDLSVRLVAKHQSRCNLKLRFSYVLVETMVEEGTSVCPDLQHLRGECRVRRVCKTICHGPFMAVFRIVVFLGVVILSDVA